MFSLIKNYIIILRPNHWTKNLLVFAGLLFSFSFDIQSIKLAFYGFLLFSLTSGIIYIINDIVDKEKDKLHPKKKFRPIPAGKIREKNAFIFAFLIFLPVFSLSYFLNLRFFIVLLIYFVINTLYSFILKNVVIVDIAIIAVGFILRAIAGVFLINVRLSDWFILATLFISLFLAVCKRRHELLFVEENAKRDVLQHYNTELINILIAIFSTGTILTYSIYVVFEHPEFMPSLIFVIYGILRYLYLVYKKEKGGEPEKILLNDIHILSTVLLYVVFIVSVHVWRKY